MREIEFVFSGSAHQQLSTLAKMTGLTKEQVIERAIGLYEYLNDFRGTQSFFTIEHPNDTKRVTEVTLP